MLAGCSSLSSEINPVSWWHSLEGGTVAEQRPPPPGADQPYPNLSTVPPKPKPPDPALRGQIANALIADRANAHYAAAQNPIPTPAAPGQPGLFGGKVPPAPPTDPDASSASMPGASAPAPPTMPFKPAPPPAPATPPSRAPRVGVSQSPLAPPAPPAGTQQAAAEPPSIPAAPPPPPSLPGVDVPVTTAPVPAPVAPPPPPARPAGPTPAEYVAVAFPPGSAVLPPGADTPLKHLVTLDKAGLPYVITGFGEANSSAPDSQDAGVKLGMERAEAIAAVFAASGVKAPMMRLNAQASGTGGDVRLQH